MEDDKGPSLVYFKALTLVLMVSRLVLVYQYLQSLWSARHYKKTILPMLMIASTYFVAAGIYLGLLWSFKLSDTGKDISTLRGSPRSGVRIWSSVCHSSLSSSWGTVSSLWRRLPRESSKSAGVLEFSGSTVGSIISANFISYIIYMLYFDWKQEEHFGTTRHQIWSFLHFPLPLTLVLAVEGGVAQSISWRTATYRYNTLTHTFQDWYTTLNATSVPASAFESMCSELCNTTQAISHAALTNSASLDGILDVPNV